VIETKLKPTLGKLAVTSGYMDPVTEADRQAARYMSALLDGRAAWRFPDA
jgi:hypothetical protein